MAGVKQFKPVLTRHGRAHETMVFRALIESLCRVRPTVWSFVWRPQGGSTERTWCQDRLRAVLGRFCETFDVKPKRLGAI